MQNIDEDDVVLGKKVESSLESPGQTMADMIIQDSNVSTNFVPINPTIQRSKTKNHSIRGNKSVALTNNYTPNVVQKSFDASDDASPPKSSQKSAKRNLSSSVIPGALISNTRMQGKQNLAMSVGMGLRSGDLGSLKLGSKILDTLADDANLPEEFDECGKESFNLNKMCELCEVVFNKIKGINRHHCRKCHRSVCTQCSNNKRKLSKKDDTLHKVCDFCDT